MNRNYRAIGVVAVFIAIVALITYLHGVSIPVLEPKGPIALSERSVIFLTLALCAIVVVPVFVMLSVFAWKYRADNPTTRRHHEPEWDHYNTVAEIVWWLVPAMIVAALSVVAWRSSHALDPYIPLQGSGTPITVEVVALDWKWLFIYPESGVASVNMLEIPEGSPIHFELTADAPMNSFWIPSLGGQIMVMPGMTTQLNLMATTLGDFNGLSGNISGAGFAGMAFSVKSVSQDDFNTWVRSVQASSTPLTMLAYQALAQASTYDPVSYYSPVIPGLYTGIIMKFMMPIGGSSSAPNTSSSMSNMQMNGMSMQ